MNETMTIQSNLELSLYLDDIKEYVNSLLSYHNGNKNLDLDEIMIYLSLVDEIIEAIKNYLNENL